MKWKVIFSFLIFVFSGFLMGNVASYAQLNSENILKKQQEVDQFLFEEHREELAAKGITVTHTVPEDLIVEIGIIPFTQENANYLYTIFGKNSVKVVEGAKATMLMSTEPTSIKSTENGLATTIENSKEDTEEINAPIVIMVILLLTRIAVLILRKNKMIN